ncbi:MAG: hypothetical protein JXB32_20005, partial [Deltaproteobacteria bacterium]|nr:hypothetical protein [Deltaproteobacteria bacterium]
MARDAGRAGAGGRGRRTYPTSRLARLATLTAAALAAGPACRSAETKRRPEAPADTADLADRSDETTPADDDAGTTADGPADGADRDARDGLDDAPELEIRVLVVELGPVLTGRTARDAAEAFAAADFEEAARLFDDVRRGLAGTADGWYEATLMAGLAHLEAGAERRAALRLGELADRDHALRPFARLQLARAELGRRKPEQALALLEGDW